MAVAYGAMGMIAETNGKRTSVKSTPNGVQVKTIRNKAKMINSITKYGVIATAARKAKLSRTQHFEWMKGDPAYVEKVHIAIDTAIEEMEHACDLRGVHGVDEQLYYQGDEITVRGKPAKKKKYSDNLLMFRLKALRPDKYADRQINETKVSIDWQPIWDLPPAERARRMENYHQRYTEAKQLVQSPTNVIDVPATNATVPAAPDPEDTQPCDTDLPTSASGGAGTEHDAG